MAFFQLGTIIRGNGVVLTYRAVDPRVTPPLPMDPNEWVRVSIRRPDGTSAVTDANMTKIKVGYYTYTFQTQSTDLEGVWEARAKTRHLGVENLSDWDAVFNLKAA